ncbi:four helix bundle protein [Candidatus Wolfebacteria bacterium]|nr:MAG: four helix bundle protein [Candidatus Wolfebacteria bacterium]
MNKEENKIKSFTDLYAWKEGHKLVMIMYEMTIKFPREEQFGLTSQMKRASVSITSNLAEGFSRGSYPDKIRFYLIALGSLTEIQNQILITKDLGFIDQKGSNDIANRTVTTHKLINGLIKKSKTFSH